MLVDNVKNGNIILKKHKNKLMKYFIYAYREH